MTYHSFIHQMHWAVACLSMGLLAACTRTAQVPETAAQRYRCEHGIEFSARFMGEAVALDSSRGYELLFRDDKPLPDPPKPHEYRNPYMSAEFQLGQQGTEALLRYPLLPLVVRCIREN
jgi:hypothetical protein